MAIEQDKQVFCKVVHHENGRVMTRRVHEIVAQAADGRTFRFKGEELPDSISLFTGQLEEGKHFADVFLGSRLPRPRFFGFIQKPKIRDLFYLWLGAFSVTSLMLIVLGFMTTHQ
jgi:hypothetical protein